MLATVVPGPPGAHRAGAEEHRGEQRLVAPGSACDRQGETQVGGHREPADDHDRRERI